MLKNVHKDHRKTNPHKLSGLVKILRRDLIGLYDEQIEFRLLFAYKH